MKELATYFNPFFESNPIPNFWKQERANPTLRDHYSNVQNLMDKSAIANDLQAISARANALLGLPLPDQLFFTSAELIWRHRVFISLERRKAT